MSKHKKSKTRFKKTIVIESPVESFNVMETHFPEFWGKCRFRIRRILVSDNVTFIYVEAKDRKNNRHTIIITVEDSVGMFGEYPEFEDAVIFTCEKVKGNVVLFFSKQFLVYGSRILVSLVKGGIEKRFDRFDQTISSTSIP